MEGAITNLTVELQQSNADFQRQSLFKRIWEPNKNARVIEVEIDSYKRQIVPLRAEEVKLSDTSAKLQKFMDYVAELAPQSPEHKAQILKALKLEKKELQMEKKEATTTMTAIRHEARVAGSEAGKTWLGFYDSELAAAQRRGIRHAKEESLAPYESTKEELASKIIGIERRILFVEKFQ